VASIHATIIAIWVAVAVGYFGIVFGAMHSLSESIIADALALQRQRLGMRYDHPLSASGYDGRDDALRVQLFTNLTAIGFGTDATRISDIGKRSPPSLDDTVPAKDREADRGFYLLRTLCLLLTTYPLQDSSIDSVAAVRTWLPNVRTTVQNALRDVETRSGFVRGLIERYATEQWEPNQVRFEAAVASQAPERAFSEWHRRATDPRQVFEDYVRRLTEIWVATEGIARDLDRYRNYVGRRLPRGKVVVIAFVLTVSAFISGVLIPLIDVHIARWVYVGIPSAIYVVAILVVAEVLLRAYQRRAAENDT